MRCVYTGSRVYVGGMYELPIHREYVGDEKRSETWNDWPQMFAHSCYIAMVRTVYKMLEAAPHILSIMLANSPC